MGRFALLVFVAGCWSTTPPPQPPRDPVQQEPPVTTRIKSHRKTGPSRCERAIDHTIEKVRTELDRMGIKPELVREPAVQSCEIAAWSDEATACFEAIADFAAINTCRTKLTSEQMKDLDTRMRDALNTANT
jgi:hypothetical protein